MSLISLLLHDYLKSCNRYIHLGLLAGGLPGLRVDIRNSQKSLTYYVGTYSAVDWQATIMSIARS